MTFLDTIATELLGPKSVAELSKAGGASTEQTQQLVTAALPLLLSGMLQNSGTEEGAQSLAQALADHAADAEKSTSSMLKKADVDDGKKIVKHVLGTQEKDITKGLAGSTGLSQAQVATMIGQLAPVVLSLMGSHVQTQQPVQQVQTSPDLTSLLGAALLGNGYQQLQPQQQSGLNLASLAGTLLGGQTQPVQQAAPAANLGTALLGSLLGGGQTQQQQTASAGASLLGALLGGGQAQQAQQTTTSGKKPKKPAQTQQVQQLQQAQPQQQSGGLDLSSVLLSLLK